MLAGDPAAVAIARAVCDPDWLARAEPLKQTPRVSVRAGGVHVRGVIRGEVVVKSMTLDRVKDRVSARVGATRLMRQWRGAMRLGEAGLGVARPIVLFRGRSARGKIVETLVMERVGAAHPSLLHLLASGDLSVRDEHRLGERLGGDLRAMFDAGLWNRDHKPSNMVAIRNGGGVWRVVYVDTPGVRAGGRHRVGADRIARTLASMVLEPIGTGCLPRRGVMMRVLRALHQSDADARAMVRRDWRAVAAIVRTHGDPTPEDDPLG